MYFAGLDIGSTMTKAVIIEGEEKIVNYVLGPTGPEHRRMANQVMKDILDQAGLSLEDMTYIVSTGYGRVSVPFSDAQITEITCHARGISQLFPEARTIIEIGGQDCKAIQVANGKVKNFMMNDRCAAGTGRFLEIIAETLGVKVSELEDLSAKAKDKIKISNICTLFAVQEIIAYLAQGISREDLVAGLHEGIAIRVCNMVSRIGIANEVIVTGGGAKNKGLVGEIENQLGIKVFEPTEPLISGALGAALLAKERTHMALEKGKPLPSKERRLQAIRLFD
jgi:predicted CoA-substrate-specific enzyme activase